MRRPCGGSPVAFSCLTSHKMLLFASLRQERSTMRRLTLPLLMVSTILAVARASSAQVTPAATSNWNREAAAAYLDQRMDEWFARGDKLRTGQGQTTCVS